MIVRIVFLISFIHGFIFIPSSLAEEKWPDMSIFHLNDEWLDHKGGAFYLKEFSEKPTLVAMVYTSCQYSCPMITSKIIKVKNSLPENTHNKINYALISFDPDGDTPEVLSAYRKKRELDQNWTLLTSNKRNVRNLAAVLGVNYKKMDDGEFSHSNNIFLLNKKGEIVSKLEQLNTDPQKMATKLKELLRQ